METSETLVDKFEKILLTKGTCQVTTWANDRLQPPCWKRLAGHFLCYPIVQPLLVKEIDRKGDTFAQVKALLL